MLGESVCCVSLTGVFTAMLLQHLPWLCNMQVVLQVVRIFNFLASCNYVNRKAKTTTSDAQLIKLTCTKLYFRGSSMVSFGHTTVHVRYK